MKRNTTANMAIHDSAGQPETIPVTVDLVATDADNSGGAV